MTYTSQNLAIRREEKSYSAGLGEFTLKELIRFAELASSLHTTAPKALHEMWQCVKDDYSVKLWASELIRLGMPNAHPWLDEPEALRIAKQGLPFFYTERLIEFGRILEFRPTSIAELAVGQEYERGLIHLAFLQHQVP